MTDQKHDTHATGDGQQKDEEHKKHGGKHHDPMKKADDEGVEGADEQKVETITPKEETTKVTDAVKA